MINSPALSLPSAREAHQQTTRTRPLFTLIGKHIRQMIRIFSGFKASKSIGKSVSISKCLSTSTVPEMPPCDHKPRPYEGPDYTKVQSIKKQNIVPCILSYYKKPLLLHEGHMQWLFDHTGKRYLDMFGGIVTVSVGHCHPKVNEATIEQMQRLWHTTNIYMHPKLHEYAEALTSKMPGELKVIYFVNSGSEANDLAMLMARAYTRNFDIISLRNGYHGMNPYIQGATALSTWRYNVPLGHGIHHAMNPDIYQGIWGGSHCRDSPIQSTRKCSCKPDECQACDMYYGQLEEVFKYSLPRGKIAAFFAESIQGVGGTVQFPKGYIKKAFEIVRANGGLCVSDEVQTGFGRTGDTFWGFESHGVVPDIVTMAKGIGNGFPLAAVVTTPAIAESLGQALHFNTYGGNPIACATGLAVLKVIDEEGTQANSLAVGTHFLKRLAKMRDAFPNVVGDVRGKGLMVGVELVSDGETRTPMQAPHFLEIWEECKDRGVLLGRGGLHGNVLRIKPPMCITKQDADFAADILHLAIARFADRIRKK